MAKKEVQEKAIEVNQPSSYLQPYHYLTGSYFNPKKYSSAFIKID
jgi:hypothetical protein